MSNTFAPSDDTLGSFALSVAQLRPSHPRRLGLVLAQLGLLVTAGGFCISIVAMNIGLIASLVGCLVARAPLHRLPTCWAFLIYLMALMLSTLSHGELIELIKTAVIPIGILTAQ